MEFAPSLTPGNQDKEFGSHILSFLEGVQLPDNFLILIHHYISIFNIRYHCHSMRRR